MFEHCPHCGPGEFECIATNEHRREDDSPLIYTCLNCNISWNAAGQIVAAPPVEPAPDTLPDLPFILD